MNDSPETAPPGQDPRRPQPGVAAIGLWMFLMCIFWLLGVSQHKLPKIALLMCVAFAAGGQGLLRQKRWGWAMTLAAIFLSALHAMWMVAEYHQIVMLALAAFDMILFLYLIRPEVRQRMR